MALNFTLTLYSGVIRHPHDGEILFSWDTKPSPSLATSLGCLANTWSSVFDYDPRRDDILWLFLFSHTQSFFHQVYQLTPKFYHTQAQRTFEAWLRYQERVETPNIPHTEFLKRITLLPSQTRKTLHRLEKLAKRHKDWELLYRIELCKMRWEADYAVFKQVKKANLKKVFLKSILMQAPKVYQKTRLYFENHHWWHIYPFAKHISQNEVLRKLLYQKPSAIWKKRKI